MNILRVKNIDSKLFGAIEIPKRHSGHIVIFVHGILSGVDESQRFTYLKKTLHRSGIATCGFYLPSHGLRNMEPFQIEECVKTVENSIQFVKQNFANLKITLLGVSLGSSLIPLISMNYLKKVETLIMFSLIPDLTVFERFKFEESHYKRWETYGYTKEKAEKILNELVADAKRLSLYSKIRELYHEIKKPKFIIYGYHDRVTSYEEIQSFVDEDTFFFTYNGPESTHDLKGKSLKCACSQIVTWINS